MTKHSIEAIFNWGLKPPKLGKILKQWRLEAGYKTKMQAAADAIGISREYLSKLEHGKARTTTDRTLVRMALTYKRREVDPTLRTVWRRS